MSVFWGFFGSRIIGKGLILRKKFSLITYLGCIGDVSFCIASLGFSCD